MKRRIDGSVSVNTVSHQLTPSTSAHANSSYLVACLKANCDNGHANMKGVCAVERGELCSVRLVTSMRGPREDSAGWTEDIVLKIQWMYQRKDERCGQRQSSQLPRLSK